ncbi:hypothetical protein H9P43_002237 [Blastocladiella emersonii ATCC 22665]|nr:hypothetical protein H9P43_002237 [Blastocladiella emersonii ATCC 22665]
MSFLNRILGGTRLEVFKFGFYVFSPIVVMYLTGIPEFVEKEVNPLRVKLFRLNDETYHPPANSEEIGEYMQLLRTRKERLTASNAAAAAAEGAEPKAA